MNGRQERMMITFSKRWFLVAVVMFLALVTPKSACAMLHPQQGRFMQRDPVGYVDGMSVYQYERGGPIDEVDPSGRWTSGPWPLADDHGALLEESLDAAIIDMMVPGPWGKPNPLGTCSQSKLYDVLHSANVGQDSGAGYHDMRRHYNRDEKTSIADADKAYQQYLKEEMGQFTTSLKDAAWPPTERWSNCNKALKALGRLTHSWQDYYAHAVLPDGKVAPAWSAVPPITGSPDSLSSGLHASVFSGPFGAGSEHGIGEPTRVIFGGTDVAEAVARRTAAIEFVRGKLRTMLPQWAKQCACVCD